MELLFIVVIAVLPSFLVGGTTLWACGVTFILLGTLLLVKPPVLSLGAPLNILIGIFILLALVSFVPANWFGLPEWRRTAIREYSIPLPSTLAPQPWLAAEESMVLVAGIAWFYLLFEMQGRSSYYMAGPLKLFCAGLALLAAVSIILYLEKIRWPFEDAVAAFGPFPNKNQSGHVFAVGTLLSVACVYDGFRRGIKGTAAWMFCAVLLFTALVLSNSRGALIVFLVGLVGWLAIIVALSRSRAKLALGAATVSALLAAFVIFGGPLLERLEPADAGGADISQDGRWKIQKDAMSLAFVAPLTGSGLASFEPVFSLFHNALGKTLMGNLHPESDWLWLVDEMGWGALAVVLAGVFILARDILPLNTRDEYWHFRAVALVAGLVFFLHGFVDVAGHRLGSFLVALFAISFSAPRLPAGRKSVWVPWIFRCAGLLLVAVGAVWVVATARGDRLPGTLAADSAQGESVAAYTKYDFASATAIATEGLRWSPMQWRLYYDRAVGEALSDPPKVDEARKDFLRARFLQPVAAELPYNEGLVWINEAAPDLVFQAWEEALRRVPDEYRTGLYGAMLGVAKDNAQLQGALRKLAGNDHGLIVAFLAAAKPADVMSEIDSLRASDPELDSFSQQEKKSLLELWAQHGDKAELIGQIQAKQKWLAVAWPLVVEQMASSGNYEEAYALCHQFANLPAIPDPISADGDPKSTLQAIYYSNPGDFLAAFSLFDLYRKAGDLQTAGGIIEKITTRKGCPPYAFRAKAEFLAAKGQWQGALEALQASKINDL